MKPFNLEEYLANPTKKLITRDGREVKRVLCTDVKGKCPIVVVIENRDGNTERAIPLTKDGKFFDDSQDNKDLFFAPEKHEGWINLYRTETSSQYVTSNPYDSEEKAIEIGRTSENYIATTKIKWEE